VLSEGFIVIAVFGAIGVLGVEAGFGDGADVGDTSVGVGVGDGIMIGATTRFSPPEVVGVESGICALVDVDF
jgi:hypothetical protein